MKRNKKHKKPVLFFYFLLCYNKEEEREEIPDGTPDTGRAFLQTSSRSERLTKSE